MARGINKVILIGNLGADPDMKSMPSGDAIANFSLATSENWNDKQSGEKREKTEWHRIVAFGRLGEIIGQYCRKGSKIYIEGRLQTRKWTDKEGIERYSTEIIANEMQMLDSRNDNDGEGYAQQQYQNNSRPKNNAGGNRGNNYSGYGNNKAKGPTGPVKPKQPPQSYGPEDDSDSFEDSDIPF